MQRDSKLAMVVASLNLWTARRGWSDADLAARAGLDVEVVRSLMAGNDPGAVAVKALATACGVGVDALFAGLEPMADGRRTAPSYVAATVRCGGSIYREDFPRCAISVDLADGTVLRVHLSISDTRFLSTGLAEFVAQVPADQSPISSGSPSVEGSVVPGQSQ